MTNRDTKDQQPLDVVISKIASGSEAELARLLDLSRSTVNCWRSEARRPASLVGTIPPKYHRRIFELAAEKGVTITADDLIAG